MANINFEKIISQIKQKIENMNLKDKWYRVKQAIENMNLKDKWSKFKLTLDQIPIPKWMLVIMTFVSVVVAIASFVSKSPTSKSYNNIVENKRSASADKYDDDKYDVMLDEYALKIDRLIDLINDMCLNSNDAFAPFEYSNKIDKLAKEIEKLEKQLKKAPLDSRQKLYKEEIEAELEDALTWYKYNY